MCGKRSGGRGRFGFWLWMALGLFLVAMLGSVAWADGVEAVGEEMSADCGDGGDGGEDEITSFDQIRAGTLLVRAQSGRLVRAPTLETDVGIEVAGLVARTVVRQRFTNPQDVWLEGIYVFPLPENAAVDAMRLVIGERIVEGEIQERAQARKVYEQAKSSGQKASLVEQERPNLFTTSVANIGPRETVDVVIEYQQELRYDAGTFELRFPMVVHRRYVPSGRAELEKGEAAPEPARFDDHGWAAPTAAVPDAGRITPPQVSVERRHGKGVEVNPVNLSLRLDLGMPLAAVESPSHRLEVTADPQRGPHAVRVEPRAGVVPADREFVVTWSPRRGDEPTAALFRRTLDGTDYVLLMVVPPSDEATQVRRLPRETIFVLDRSGSMGGTSMAQAKEALLFALDRLHPGDTFNVIEFDDRATKLFEHAVPAEAIHLETARRFVRRLDARGGTEMLEALRLAFDDGEAPPKVADEGRLRQVIFVTDGSVGDEERLFGFIHQNLGDRRLFTVGIGSAPNSHFMRRAAEVGRGTYTFVSDPGEVAARMGDLFAKLESPVLSDLVVRFDDPVAEVFPEVPGDLYLGEPLVVAARSPAGLHEVTVEGWRGSRHWQVDLPLAGGAKSAGVDKLWARRKIDQLETERARIASLRPGSGPEGLDAVQLAARRDGIRAQVVELGLHHHLVTKHTSLVAVDKTPVRPEDAGVESAPVPVHTPAGFQGVLPKGGTDAVLHLLAGLLLLASAWLVLRTRV